MQSTFSRTLRLFGAMLAISTLCLTAVPANAQANANQVNDMTGSWLFSLTVTPPGVQFLALATFTKDGTFVGTAQPDGTCCPTEGPAHGVWVKTGSHSYAVKFYTLERNVDGSLYAIFKVGMTLVLDPKADKVTGTWEGHTFGPAGNEIAPAIGGPLTASRITLP